MTMGRVRIGAAATALVLVAGCASAGTTIANAGGPPKKDCPPTTGGRAGVIAAIDYIDFIQAFGRQYDAGYNGARPMRVHKSQLGPVVLRSTCSLSALNDRTGATPGAPRDGNTAFLPVGTPIYAIHGWPTSCRLAARSARGQLQAYLAMRKHTRHATPRACALRR